MPGSFSLRLAVGWTVLVTAGMWFGLEAVFAAFPRAGREIVILGATQVLVYALVLVAFCHAQDRPFGEVLGLRRASLGVCLGAAALGVALQIPATLLSDAVEHFFPTPAAVLSERLARITPHSAWHGLAVALVVAGLGPCVEELFFRCALFGALRRDRGKFVTIWSVSLCFVFAHLDLRLLLPLLVAALSLGQVREQSGSVWPGVALHAAFNAVTLGLVFSGHAAQGKPPPMPVLVAILGCVVTALLLGLVRSLALSSRVAQNARYGDQRS